MDQRTRELLESIEKRPGASNAVVDRLRRYVGVDLPSGYLEFLRWSNGAQGPIRPYLPLLAENLTRQPPDHILFGVEEVLEYAESVTDYFCRWRELWPGHLAISFTGGYVGLIDTRSRDPGKMPYLLGDCDEGTIIYRMQSCAEMIENLSTAYIDLTRANLRGVCLRGVHMLHAILHYAFLTGADLTGADLRNCFFEGADLTEARLANVDLTGAWYDADTRWPHGFNPQQHGALH